MLHKFTQAIFGCAHANYTWPQTDIKTGETHVTCLNCGREFPYDFELMKRLEAA